LAIEDPDFGMFEVGEVIVVTMNNDGTIADVSGVETIGRFATDSLGKSECKEADASHKRQDDANETELFTPCSLLFRSANTCWTCETQNKIYWTAYRMI
jgi:hypothetical protein